MRVPYFEPSVREYDRVFQNSPNISGGGLSDIRVFSQKGGSFLGVISSIMRRAIPFLRSMVLPEMGNMARNVAHDYGSRGTPLNQTLRENALSTGKNIARKILGGARKGKKKGKNAKKSLSQTKKRKKTTKTRAKTRCRPKGDIFESGIYPG